MTKKSIFSQIESTNPRSNTFDLSHDRKLSLNMGELIPILSLETIPGDKFRMSTSQMLRLAPLLSPVMHQITVYTHFFFVPNRICWSNWEDFITGGEDGTDASVFPTINYNNASAGSLRDYMGLPTKSVGLSTSELVSAMPFCAYNKIYNEYYRDQNLITKLDDSLIDGNNGILPTTVQLRAWQHDYFTSALPWTQKGAEATIPLGTTAPVVWDFNRDGLSPIGANPIFDNTGSAYTGQDPIEGMGNITGTENDNTIGANASGTRTPLHVDNSLDLSTDLSSATAATINDLRNAFRLQEWLEKNARGGSRYVESILSHFGVKSSDARLQRPEYLGGGSSPVTISEVLQTSNNDTQDTPQGNMAGHGITVGANGSFTYHCEEHGYIMGIMSILPKTAYQDGIPKHFLKFDKFDYFFPSFAHLGEQPIQNKELYVADDGLSDDTFGYTPRYAEYKYMNSSVHGELKTTLDFWHMGRIFATRPTLNQTFIESVPTDRIFAVLTGEKIYAHIYHSIKATRKMPFFGTPTL